MNYSKHEDSRRVIYDWASGSFASAKVVIVKESIPIGDHYHLNKEEEFFLLEGEFIELHLGKTVFSNVYAPQKVHIPKGLYHKFICTPGSILLGIATQPFDPNDEIKL